MFDKLATAFNNMFAPPEMGGLTQDEYEEWEYLSTSMEWNRTLTLQEQERYMELELKRTTV